MLDAPIDDDAGAVADREQRERGFIRLKPEQRAVVVLHHSRYQQGPGQIDDLAILDVDGAVDDARITLTSSSGRRGPPRPPA